MTPTDVIDLGRDALWTLIQVCAPVMLIGLTVGLIISLLQALTQIQEMTIAFVPKILVVFVALVVFMPFMIQVMIDFTTNLFDKVIVVGRGG